ncbi:MAG: aminopeptidase P family protein [Clostridia bacterium]|nr:aminopeptidase P family protein [Clostridia bacterium]
MTNLQKIQAALKDARLDALLLMNNKNVFYATGFLPADSAAVITGDRAFLITDSRYIEAARYESDPEAEVILATRERSLITCIKDIIDIRGIERLGAEENYLSFALYTRIGEKLGMSLLPGQSIVTELRQSKSETELCSIISAQRIAERALNDVLGLIKPGISERELAAELTYRMLLYGGEGNSFDPIVIAGSKTSMPHGVPGDDKVVAGGFVTMDFGCVKNGYCSDMTRTVAVGSATDEMKNVYETVLHAQIKGIEAARPGATGASIHAAAAKVIENAGFGEYFGHGFGHGVGLDIHEKPNASPANKEPLREGAVISAEPGIYIPGRFGVRIEDMLFLTGEGNVNITKAPKAFLIL